MVGAQGHASECTGGMDCVLARNDWTTGEHGRVVCGGTGGQEHGGVFRLT